MYVASDALTPAALVDMGWMAHGGSAWVADAGTSITIGDSTPLAGTLTAPAKELVPAKIVNQKLITVRPTFLLPAKGAGESTGGSKFASDTTTLNYGIGEVHSRGMADVTREPVRANNNMHKGRREERSVCVEGGSIGSHVYLVFVFPF